MANFFVKRRNLFSNFILALIFIAFGLIAISYSFLSPSLEAPDETWHYEYVKFLADGNFFENYKIWDAPPLYYIITSIPLHFFGYPEITEIEWNPTIDPLIHVNYHSTEEIFPYSGTASSVHFLRFFSILFGFITLYFTYRITKFIFPNNVWLQLIPVGIVAFIPLFPGNGSSVINDDSLVHVFGTIFLFYILKFVTFPRKKFLIMAGIFMGLLFLTKQSAIMLYPIFFITLVFLLKSKQLEKKSFFYNSLLFLIVSISSGGFYFILKHLMSRSLIGNFISGDISINFIDGLSKITWDRTIHIFEGIWGYQSWYGRIWAPDYIPIGDLLVIFSIAGLGFLLIRKSQHYKIIENNHLFVLLITAVLMYSFIFISDILLPISEGPAIRYILPLISSYGILFSLGFYIFFNYKKIRIFSVIPVFFLLALNVFILSTMFGTYDHGLKPHLVEPIIDPYLTINQIYHERSDIREKFNEHDYEKLFEWASTKGALENDTLKKHELLFELLVFYYSDIKLQEEFPEVSEKHHLSNFLKASSERGLFKQFKDDHRYLPKFTYALKIEGLDNVCQSSSTYVEIRNLKKVFCNRYDLIDAISSVYVNDDLQPLFLWAHTFGYYEERELSQFRPFYTMMVVYYSDVELQNAFPEARNAKNIQSYLHWINTEGIKKVSFFNEDKEYYLELEERIRLR